MWRAMARSRVRRGESGAAGSSRRARGEAGPGGSASPRARGDVEPLAVAEDRGPLDHRGELADVARPGVLDQQADVLGRRRQRRHAEPLGGPEREVRGQRRDVREALAQRGQVDREDGQPVPEVLAGTGRRRPSPRGRGGSRRRSARRRDRPARRRPARTGRPGGRAAAGPGRPAAARRISSRNSVPPSARSNQPLRSPTAPVKLPRLVPEQLGVDQLRRDRPAVDPQERARDARRDRVWIARATTSLPEPVSPRISTGASERATSSMCSMTSFRPVSAPMTESAMSLRPSRDSSDRFSASTASRREISSRTRWSFSRATANGSTRSRTTASCSSPKEAGGRATMISTPRSPFSVTSGAASSARSGPRAGAPGAGRAAPRRPRESTRPDGTSP